MAYVNELKPPTNGMTEFLNVGAKVGFDPDCPNRPHDVKAVQQLLALILSGTKGVKIGVPAPTGIFDALTGFHIFYVQSFIRKSRPGTIVDGCVSPATGLSYGGGAIFSVVYLNLLAYAKQKAEWTRLLEPYRPL